MHKYNYKKYYFISTADTNLINNQDKNINIIYRNYNTNLNIKEILNLKYFCKKKKIKFFLANNVKLAINLDLDGAYIPSFNKNTNHLAYSLKKTFLLLGSAHNKKEIIIKNKQNVKILFISSLFKENKNFLGLNKFRNLSQSTNLKVIALGGISKKNVRKLDLINVFGFAGISFFNKKKGP